MRLCFDATRFGCGLDGAIELAAVKNVPAVEYSFAPFAATAKGARSLDDKEKKYLKSVSELSKRHRVELACLNLDYCLDPLDKKASKQFALMLSKLVRVCAVVKCNKVTFSLSPGIDEAWKDAVEEQFATWQDELNEHDVKLLLRLATPMIYRDQSLKKWRAMEPQDWRDLISACPGLSLSFSPADCVWQSIDYLRLLSGLTQAIDHVEAHDIEINRPMLNDSGLFGPLWWRYRIAGKGQVDWGQLIEALKLYDFTGTFSVHVDDEFIASEHEELQHALDSSLKVVAPLVRD